MNKVHFETWMAVTLGLLAAAEIDKLCEEYATDYQKLMELDSQKNALDEELLSLYEKWEELNS